MIFWDPPAAPHLGRASRARPAAWILAGAEDAQRATGAALQRGIGVALQGD